MNVVIEKIEIVSFGKLKNAVVTPASGINILSAPNESGKSTLAAFIKFVFYGFVGARMQTLTENERKLYTPWDNDVSEGSITVCADGERYIVHRRCLPSGKETVDVVNRNTGKCEFIGEVPGEVFFGVGEDVFARTLFFRQLTTPQSKDELLADKLRNIAISADEQVGTKKAVTRLSEAKNELKGRSGNGLIPKAENERDMLESAITDSVDLRREVQRLRSDIKKRSVTISDAEQKLARLNDERRNIEKYDAYLRLRTINRLVVEENIAREEYEKVSAGLKRQADGGAFSTLSAKNAELVAEQRNCKILGDSIKTAQAEYDEMLAELPFEPEDAVNARKLIASSEKKSKITFIAAGIAAVAGILIYFATLSAAGFLGVAAAVLIAAYGAVILGKPAVLAKELELNNATELKEALERFPIIEKQLDDMDERLDSLEASYDESRMHCLKLKNELDAEIGKYAEVSGSMDYALQIEHILSASAESGEKLAVLRAKSKELASASEGLDVEALAEEAHGATQPERDRAKVDREIAFYTQQFNQLSELNRNDELECAALEAKSGDPATLIGKRDSLNVRIDDLTVKHKAYETAIRVIEEASDYMKSMVAPRIGERADEYFTAATGGKYNSFEVDTRLSMSFGEDFRRSCDYLSAGTRDSAYLSLRLALADMLFGGCGVPILLDDAFGRIDNVRLRMIAGALAEAAKKHQIFILTHSDREASAFDDIAISYTNISITQ